MQGEIVNVACNIATHQSKPIEGLCLNPHCKENATLCSKCLFNGHSQCRDQIIELDLIPKQLIELQELSFDIVVLQQMINQQFKELLSQIEQMLSSIPKYHNMPNLPNLNEIGLLLKQNPKQHIQQLIEGTKNQIKMLLNNQNIKQEKPKEQEKKQIKIVEVQENNNKQQQNLPKQEAQNWFDQGFSLFRQDNYPEAINCFDQAIKIYPQHLNSWYFKGRSLWYQSNYPEAINCFDQAIKIDPQHLNSWHMKGQSLYWYQRIYAEAINCFDQAIKIDPQHLNSWYYKGRSLLNLKKYAEAIKSYEECNKIKPNYAESELMDAQEALKKSQECRLF